MPARRPRSRSGTGRATGRTATGPRAGRAPSWSAGRARRSTVSTTSRSARRTWRRCGRSIPSAQAGDQLVLLAMHLTTREIPDWIWTTYWWHDRPDAGPFAADRPAAVAGVWRNYLMDVAYSAATPAEADGAPNIAFNPYLETFAAGTRSNCMACHQGAVWTPSGAAPVPAGDARPAPARRPALRRRAPGSTSCGRSPPRRADRKKRTVTIYRRGSASRASDSSWVRSRWSGVTVT